MSKETLDYHYGKHHAGYVKKLNKAVEGEGLAGKSLLELIRSTEGGTFNNAAQVWNHTFFWDCLCPTSQSSDPSDELRKALDKKFGSMDAFKQEFADAAAGNFGSGWTWLTMNPSGDLQIVNTSDADTPVRNPEVTALMTLDVWEHAYYLDHRNDRGAYIDTFWKLVNWKFVSDKFAASTSDKQQAA
tara:strand:- start:543 stop:1103 length:561 start_codon:yes stop_codon:yes gene_type:complete